MHRFLKLLCLCLLPATLGMAQTNFKRATITANSGQQTAGFIDHREWTINPLGVDFKRADTPGAMLLSARDIIGFSIEGQESYERLTLKAPGSGKIKRLADIPYGKANAKGSVDTVFGRLISSGSKYNLYVHEDKLRVRFFLKDNHSGVMTELVIVQYYDVNRESSLITETPYKSQLTAIADQAAAVADKGLLLRKIQVARYNADDLRAVIGSLNGESDARKKGDGRTAIRPFGGAFMQTGFATYKGEIDFAADGVRQVFYTPGLAFGIDMYNNYYVGKYKIRMEAEVGKVRYHTESRSQLTWGGEQFSDHAFTQLNFTFTPQFIANLYNTKNFKINLGVGMGINVSSTTDNVFLVRTVSAFTSNEYERNFVLNKLWMNLPVRAGVVIKNRIEVYGKYIHPISSLTDYQALSLSVKLVRIGVNYLF